MQTVRDLVRQRFKTVKEYGTEGETVIFANKIRKLWASKDDPKSFFSMLQLALFLNTKQSNYGTETLPMSNMSYIERIKKECFVLITYPNLRI